MYCECVESGDFSRPMKQINEINSSDQESQQADQSDNIIIYKHF